MRRIVALLIFSFACTTLSQAQTKGPEIDPAPYVKQLFDAAKWNELVRTAEVMPTRSAELDYYYGIALAKLGRWQDAHAALLAGRRLRPRDKRFPSELAGVEFRQKRYAAAAAWLQRALRLDPRDSYTLDFLGSVYFLQGNLEAALKYWNAIGKPEIARVRFEPAPRLDPVLLDHALAFSPAATLRLPDFLTTQVRIDGLGIFPVYSFHLFAPGDGQFDGVFQAHERNGWGENKWQGLASLFRGVFYQTIYPEFFNLNRSAINFTSLVRWDAQKRRAFAALSGPVGENPKWRYRFATDWRDENWNLRHGSTGAAPVLAALNLRKEQVSASLTSFQSGRWTWSAGVELSHRDYRNVFAGSVLNAGGLLPGYQLKQLMSLDYTLLRLPERRLVTTGHLIPQTGRIWSQPAHSFLKLPASLDLQWFPQSQGDDYETRARVSGGTTFGQVPFDELAMLGIERDNDLWLRAHVGTRDGRKGSAPLGRRYLLFNWETDKVIYSAGLFTVKVGPFLDSGRITDSLPNLGSKDWLWDTGLQLKLRIPGVELVLIYGKDLRSGGNVFYATTRP